MKTLELLAPAKNLECGIAAIQHGADAVYIGAPRFGARSAAGNSLEDIKQLCDYAHQFEAKVHVTINTIIYDDELEDTLKMIAELDKIGVDAILLQDMGVLSEIRANNAWFRELHASTQCDTRTPEKAEWLRNQGFCRVVLARELSWRRSRQSLTRILVLPSKSSCMVPSASAIRAFAMLPRSASVAQPTVVSAPSSAV